MDAKIVALAALCLTLTPLITASAAEPGGREIYDAKCAACHGPSANLSGGVGPSLRGVYGRKAGRAAGYLYSDALKNSTIVFDEPTLLAWLTQPTSLAAKTKMAFVPPLSAGEKTAVIAFLKGQR